MKACRLLKKGCKEYWCYVMEVMEEDVKIEDIPLECEFLNVFLEGLLGLPPQWEIDFEIELY